MGMILYHFRHDVFNVSNHKKFPKKSRHFTHMGDAP
jgi:hypothetical protein